MAGVAADIAALRARGVAVIVVSSGAIALARRTLGLTRRRLKLEEQQAAAAVGQIRLAQAWSEALSANGLTAAQLLLTLDDTEDRRRYLNARETLSTLLGLGCIPVINENDTVATAEIRFGDNDRLAARVAEMVQADQLILLSDIDGLYTADPQTRSGRGAYSGGGSIDPGDRGDGGRAAAGVFLGRDAHQAGGGADRDAGGVCDGDRPRPHAASAGGAGRGRALHLVPARAGGPVGAQALDSRRAGTVGQLSRWMPARRGRCSGGARCCRPGVRGVEGVFQRGDPVVVVDPTGAPLARGLSAYASADAERIIGHRSDEIEAILGWRGRDEMIHRDDLVLL